MSSSNHAVGSCSREASTQVRCADLDSLARIQPGNSSPQCSLIVPFQGTVLVPRQQHATWQGVAVQQCLHRGGEVAALALDRVLGGRSVRPNGSNRKQRLVGVSAEAVLQTPEHSASASADDYTNRSKPFSPRVSVGFNDQQQEEQQEEEEGRQQEQQRQQQQQKQQKEQQPEQQQQRQQQQHQQLEQQQQKQQQLTWHSAAVLQQLRGGGEEVVFALNSALHNLNLRYREFSRALVHADVR